MNGERLPQNKLDWFPPRRRRKEEEKEGLETRGCRKSFLELERIELTTWGGSTGKNGEEK